MMSNLILRVLILTFGSLLSNFCLAEGPSNGGGGDLYGLQFQAVGKKLLYRLQARSGVWKMGFDLAALEQAIDHTRVVSVAQACLIRAASPCPPGQARDAVNYSEERLIELTASSWERLIGKSIEQEDLVLHEYFGILNIEKNVDTMSRPVLLRLRDAEFWNSLNPTGISSATAADATFSPDSPTKCTAHYIEYKPNALLPQSVVRQFVVHGDNPNADCAEAERQCSQAMDAPIGRLGPENFQNKRYCDRQVVNSAETQCDMRCEANHAAELESCDSLRYRTDRERCRLDLGPSERFKVCSDQCYRNFQWKPSFHPVVPAQSLPPLSDSCAAVEGASLDGIKLNVAYAVRSKGYAQIKKFMQWADCANGAKQLFSLYDMGPDRGRHGIPSTNLLDVYTDSLNTLELGHNPQLTCSDRLNKAFVKVLSPTEIAVYSNWTRYRMRNDKCESLDGNVYKRALYRVSTQSNLIRWVGAEFNELSASSDFWGKRAGEFHLAVLGSDNGIVMNPSIEGLLRKPDELKKWVETTEKDILTHLD